MELSGHARRLMEKLDAAKTRIANVREKADAYVATFVRSGEVFAGGTGMAFINAKFGKAGEPVTLGGVPVDLGAGIGLHVIGLMGGKQADHLHSIADGLLAPVAVRLGGDLARKVTAGAAAFQAGYAPAGAYAGAGYAPAGAYAGAGR